MVSSVLVLAVITSCAITPQAESEVRSAAADDQPPGTPRTAGRDDELIVDSPDEQAASAAGDGANVALGSGQFVQAARGPTVDAYAEDEGVTLNFEQADLKEFLRVVFETILQDNYFIDSRVQGSVTLHTTRPVTRAAVLPILEAVLHGNGAALLREEGMFKIVPMADAEAMVGAPAIGRYTSNRGAGFVTQIVPLEHVAALEMQRLLGPFVPDGSALRVDEARNVLILSGPKYRIDELLATVRTFDVDWLRGMSFGIFKLRYADAATLVSELEAIVSGAGPSPLSGIVRLLPIERLNAVLVITHRPDHITDVQRLVAQLDWGVEGSAGRRLFVYELENGKAENIARTLQQIFGQVGGNQGLGDGTPLMGSEVFRSADALSRPPPEPGAGLGVAEQAAAESVVAAADETVIIADPDNNAVLVLANQQDYRAIEAVIRRLDISPRQVLIEATIAEVTLSNTLDHGVRWFLEKTDSELGFNAPVPGSASGAGLAFAFFDQDSDLTAFFDLLATESSVKFLSTPQVMVLDNQTANIRVGDQIPVTTRSSQSTTNPDAPIVTEVQFRDTGTLLTVTPSINAGGQVTLEISQEVSLPGTEPAVGGGGNVSIAQRTINSSVIVQSGQTVVLGGLILENTNNGKSGIPLLMDIPLLGHVFSSTSSDVFRTELIITVKPRVVENQRAMQEITRELRARMKKASEYESLVNRADDAQ